jgi:hypothetical protein
MTCHWCKLLIFLAKAGKYKLKGVFDFGPDKCFQKFGVLDGLMVK